MTVIQSEGALAAFTPAPQTLNLTQALTLYELRTLDYSAIYRTQPNVRTVVEFLARNIAQLGLHSFRRLDDTDRERLTDHPLPALIGRPSLRTSRYRLIESTIVDLGIWFNAFWLKIRPVDPIGLIRIPPRFVQVLGFLEPTGYIVRFPGKPPLELDADLVVHLRGPNPDNELMGLSPLETLRREVAETESAATYREQYWNNAARMGGIIERPDAAPDWSPEARERFQADFDAMYSGAAMSGRTAVLEDGMTWKGGTFSPNDSQYVEGRKFTREEVARAYHIPLPMVGILDHATFCLPGHVPVFTETGPRPIVDVQAGDRVWSHDGTGFALKSVSRSGQTGVDPILRIRTENRTLDANETHPILVRRLLRVHGVADPTAPAKVRAGQSRWRLAVQHVYVPAGDIRVGDVLVTLAELPSDGKSNETIERMEFYGLYIGDGNLMRNRGAPCGVAISRAPKALYMDHYRQEMARFTGRGGRTVTLDETGQRLQTRFMSADAARLMIARGFGGLAHTKRVPGWVFQAPRDARLGFLRGYLDSDGSVDKDGRISFSSCNPALIEDLRHICMSIGVAVNNVHHTVRSAIPLPNGGTSDVSQWAIVCSDSAANRDIGSHDPRYQDRLASGTGFTKKAKAYPIAHGRQVSPPPGCGYSRVVAIDHLPAEPVYDIEVEDSHNFVAAGVVVHNSNIEEQHRNLYQDCLGPWLTMLQEDLGLQLIPAFSDSADVYLEFNLAEKMRGSFVEQTTAFSTAVGRPWMTPNEARARNNMPRLEGDADALATPLNVLVGGQASPRDSAPPPKDLGLPGSSMPALPGNRETGDSGLKGFDPEFPRVRAAHVRKWDSELKRFFRHQREVVFAAAPKAKKDVLTIADLFDDERWNRELAGNLLALNMFTAAEFAKRVADVYGIEFDPSELHDYYQKNSRFAAEGINNVTRAAIIAAFRDPDFRESAKHVFEVAVDARAPQIGRTKVTQAANLGAARGAGRAGVKFKTWTVNSGNPRSQHAAMNGERVPFGSRFSNGMAWPGDPSASVGAEEIANCQCSCEFDR